MLRVARCVAKRVVLLQLGREMIGLATPRGRTAAMLTLVGILGVVNPDWLERRPRLCLIAAVRKQPCPACGLTRAASAFVHGDIRRAARTNPLIFPVIAVAVLMFGADTWRLLSR